MAFMSSALPQRPHVNKCCSSTFMESGSPSENTLRLNVIGFFPNKPVFYTPSGEKMMEMDYSFNFPSLTGVYTFYKSAFRKLEFLYLSVQGRYIPEVLYNSKRLRMTRLNDDIGYTVWKITF